MKCLQYINYQMWACLWMVMMIGVSAGADGNSSSKLDPVRTVLRVQAILKDNPLLPRLNESEILQLLNNITAEDERRAKQQLEDLMVVLPVKGVDLKDMYTARPPMAFVPATHKQKKTSKKPEPETDYWQIQRQQVMENLNKQNYKLKDQREKQSAYEEFKPLPVEGELDALLRKYGLLGEPPAPLRVQQEEKDQLNGPANIQAGTFPEDMTNLLTDIGLMKKNGRKLKTPTNDNVASNEVDSLESASALVANTGLKDGPDPLLTQAGDLHIRENELSQRQVNSSSTAESEKLEEKDPGASIADLEASFGASPADNDPSEAELPPPRKNGFYYMLDWNSFLEVGEGDKKVNIRFDPKLGDPQRFLQVTVP